MATVFGFAATVFISFYHFLMLEVVLNFDVSHFRIIPLTLMALTSLPMLLAFVRERELTWQPARWLFTAILVTCFIHLSLPGFTPERPRGMTLMYSEEEGSETGHVILESPFQGHDHKFARGHGFEVVELDLGGSERVQRPAREVPALNLPGVSVSKQETRQEEGSWRRRFMLHVPGKTRYVQLVIPLESELEQAWVDGQLALDTRIDSKHKLQAHALRLVYPGDGPFEIEFQTASPDPFSMSATTWHALPGVLTAPFMGNWPDNARPFQYGPRAQRIQKIVSGSLTP